MQRYASCIGGTACDIRETCTIEDSSFFSCLTAAMTARCQEHFAWAVIGPISRKVTNQNYTVVKQSSQNLQRDPWLINWLVSGDIMLQCRKQMACWRKRLDFIPKVPMACLNTIWDITFGARHTCMNISIHLFFF